MIRNYFGEPVLSPLERIKRANSPTAADLFREAVAKALAKGQGR